MERREGKPVESLAWAEGSRSLTLTGTYVTGRRGMISRTARAAVSHASSRFHSAAGSMPARALPPDEPAGKE